MSHEKGGQGRVFLPLNIMSISDHKISSHESYGTIVVTRMQSGKEHPLFGSSIQHRNTIRLEIRQAGISRTLSTDFIHPGKQIIEVEMSQSQWAEMVSSIGIGEGTPCTIRHLSGNRLEGCPYTSVREQFDEEFDDSVQESLKGLRDAVTACEELLTKKSLTKADREQVLALVRKAYQEVSDSVPFIKSQFTEQMDKTVKEAKVEIEALAMNHLLNHALGAGQIAENTMPMIDNGKDEDA